LEVPVRLRIIGDHSHYHAGSAAAFRSLVSLARSKGWTVVGGRDTYDALLVNGEGKMHHGKASFHRKMQALVLAVSDGKPAYLVNSVWQDNPHDYDAFLPQLSGIAVREVCSREDLLHNHGISAQVVPDVSLYERVGFSLFPMNFRKRPARTDFYLPETQDFGTPDLLSDVAELPFKSMSWRRAVASLRSASYLITGRQHAVYAACKARIPFAASEGNTHKIRGLIETAGVDIPIADHPSDLPSLIPIIMERQAEFEKLFDWLEGQDYPSIMPDAAATAQFARLGEQDRGSRI
jgi:hypothetical protein